MKNRLRKNLTNKEQRDHPPEAAYSFSAVLKTIELVSAVYAAYTEIMWKKKSRRQFADFVRYPCGKTPASPEPSGTISVIQNADFKIAITGFYISKYSGFVTILNRIYFLQGRSLPVPKE